MKQRYILPILLVIDFCILLFETSHLSISYNEARLYYSNSHVLSYFIHIFTAFFGENDYSLRFFMMLLHLGSVILFYKLTAYYIRQFKERIIVTILFMLLPGIMSSALIVNSAGLVVFATLLFIYLYKQKGISYQIYLLLFIYSFLDNSFAYLFLSLVFYSFYKKEWEFLGFNLFMILINLYLYTIDIGGYPTGHFLDSLAVYAAIFSPIIFIYLVYALYRSYVVKNIDIVWFIATVPFVFSLLLSLRQYVHIEYYAPFVISGLFIAAKIFITSYKVRLPQFRKKYSFLFYLAVFFLLINFFVVLSNRFLYQYFQNPKKHFAYKHDIAKELALKLKQNGIDCVHTDYKMQLRLRFYNIKECQDNILSPFAYDDEKRVTIRYNGVTVYQSYVTKLNSK